MKKENAFEKPIVMGTIGVISLLSGFYFLNNSITGSVISSGKLNFSLLSLIGMLLVACSAVLITYSIKKK